VKRVAPRPVVITDAERSQDAQLRSRQIRYLIMMLTRAGCLILAVVLVSLKVPLLGLWLSLCVAGMVLLPWLAVILANDRPPKEQYRLSNRLHRGRAEAPPANAITSAPEPTVIDADD
jgi:Flp pilus assembly protein TadB